MFDHYINQQFSTINKILSDKNILQRLLIAKADNYHKYVIKLLKQCIFILLFEIKYWLRSKMTCKSMSTRGTRRLDTVYTLFAAKKQMSKRRCKWLKNKQTNKSP
jgi:hypothetical protein